MARRTINADTFYSRINRFGVFGIDERNTVCHCPFDHSSLPLALAYCCEFFVEFYVFFLHCCCFYLIAVADAFHCCHWRMRIASIAQNLSENAKQCLCRHWIGNSKNEICLYCVFLASRWSRQTCNMRQMPVCSCGCIGTATHDTRTHQFNTKMLFLTVNLFLSFFARALVDLTFALSSFDRIGRSLNGKSGITCLSTEYEFDFIFSALSSKEFDYDEWWTSLFARRQNQSIPKHTKTDWLDLVFVCRWRISIGDATLISGALYIFTIRRIQAAAE